MILNNRFYTMMNQVDDTGSVKASVVINKDHDIFKGHFPGTPLVPGVCMMQMIKEIMEVHAHRPLRLVEAENMKFLSMLDPGKNAAVEVSVSYVLADNLYQIAASLFAGQLTFFKLKATLQPAA